MLSRLFVSFFLSLVCLSHSSLALSNTLTYITYPDGVGITGCVDSSCPSEIIVPEMIDGKTVTRIEEDAFCQWYSDNNSNPDSIILPNTIKHLGESAFCDLDSIVLPASVVSIYEPFSEISDIYIIRPADQNLNVFDFPADANLYACDGLNEGGIAVNCEEAYPDITRSQLDYDSAQALVDSNGHVEIPNTYNMIEDGAFAFSSITSITIPDSILHIGEEAFVGNNLDSLIIPSSVISIIDGTFSEFEGDMHIIKPVDQYINPYYLPHTSNHFVCESVDGSGNPVGCEDLWQSTASENQSGNQYALLDIDQNGSFDALTDGLILLRYAFGLRGDSLIDGVIDTNANRTTAAEIEAHIQSLVP